jgi:hypothetical protein
MMMAAKGDRTDKPKDDTPKRLNRTVGVSEALGRVLDSALKKRGFATRDILTHWAVMAPKPYDRLAVPDQLKWPRGAGHEGATLYLRCAPGQALALSHEAPLVVAAVNRYFGYLLVREVRLSAEPMRAAPKKAAIPESPPEDATRKSGEAVGGVENDALRHALKALGTHVIAGRKG